MKKILFCLLAAMQYASANSCTDLLFQFLSDSYLKPNTEIRLDSASMVSQGSVKYYWNQIRGRYSFDNQVCHQRKQLYPDISVRRIHVTLLHHLYETRDDGHPQKGGTHIHSPEESIV